MAKSNRKKYNRLDYVLMGVPVKDAGIKENRWSRIRRLKQASRY